MLNSSRNILALNGLILILTGITFFIFPEKISILMFPNIISNPEALEVAVVLRYMMAAGMLTLGIILYLARISVRSGAKRLLLGSGIGFFIMFFTSVFIVINYKADIPYVALILFPILGTLSLYVATRKYQI